MTTTADRPLRRDAAENRERLLVAAGQVFARHGLEAGVEEIAREAGVGMGTLYRRFESKQALIDALVGRLRRDLLEHARAASDIADGAGLEQLLFQAAHMQAAQPGCLQQLWEQSDAELGAFDEFRALLPELLTAAQAHHRVRADITVTDISMVFWSVRGVIETTRGAAPRAWRRHLELLVAGLRPVSRGRFATPLTETPMTAAQARRISRPDRAQ